MVIYKQICKFWGALMIKRKSYVFITALALSLLVLLTNQAKADVNQYKRLWGSNRYETCSAITQEGWNGGSEYAVIVNGENFPDALSAVTLAKKYNAPILLTQDSTLDTNSYNELKRLKVKTVFIVGGNSVVKGNVEQNIENLGIKTVRYKGKDRNETSVEVAKAVGTDNGIILAVDNDYTDALSAAPIAAKLQIPIILMPKDNVPESVANFIAGKNITKTYVIGGADLISDATASKFPNVERIYGNSKFERNINVIKAFSDKIDFGNICFAYSEMFPDALSGAAYAALKGNPIVLVGDSANTATSIFVKSKLNVNTGIIIFGGQAGIKDNEISSIIDTSNQNSGDVTTLVKNADEYFLSSDFKNLIDTCTNILALDASNVKAYVYRADAYAETGDNEKGINDCDKAIELDPENGSAYSIRGWLKNYISDKSSVNDSNKAVSLSGDGLLYYFFRANAYNDLSQFDKAIADLNKVIELNPKFAMAYNDLGNIYNHSKQYDKALDAYNKAISINPNIADSYYGRGNYYFNLKQYDNAIADYTKSISLNPAYIGYAIRGRSYYYLQQYGNAITDLDKAISLNPNYELAYYFRGKSYLMSNKYDKAIDDFSKAISLNPNVDSTYTYRGTAYFRLYDNEKALADLNKAISLNPDSYSAYIGIGNVYYSSKDYEKAITYYSKAISIYPNDAIPYLYRSSCYEALQQYNKAKEDYNKAKSIDPNVDK